MPKNKSKSNNYIYYIVIIILIVISASLFIGFNYANERRITLTKEFDAYKESSESEIKSLQLKVVELEDKFDSLSKENIELNKTIIDLESQKEDITSQFVRLKFDIASTVNDLEDYKKDINKSMSWFNSNSRLDDSRDMAWTQQNIRNQCYMVDDGKCYIKTACFYLVNERMLNLHYQTDIKLTDELDRLQSLQDFFSNRGGDCEDYSLFFKAEFNNLIERCHEKRIEDEDIIVEGWDENPPLDAKYFMNFNENRLWFLKNKRGVKMPEGYLHPIIVCGDFWQGGHCVIAFTKEKINTINDVYLYLNMAPMIEPQNGMYLGLINDPSSGVYINSNTDDSEHRFLIWQIVSDRDLFRYYRDKDVNWVGYSSFYDTLDDRLIALRDMQKRGTD